MLKKRPELIVCNGPGTCIPICVIAFMMRVLYITDTKIVFVESICRVKTLSLSGKILLLFADIVLVQWPKLKEIYRRTTFIGRLT
jgi:beta-1,4-N-acetylglucosaminyltransferase